MDEQELKRQLPIMRQPGFATAIMAKYRRGRSINSQVAALVLLNNTRESFAQTFAPVVWHGNILIRLPAGMGAKSSGCKTGMANWKLPSTGSRNRANERVEPGLFTTTMPGKNRNVLTGTGSRWSQAIQQPGLNHGGNGLSSARLHKQSERVVSTAFVQKSGPVENRAAHYLEPDRVPLLVSGSKYELSFRKFFPVILSSYDRTPGQRIINLWKNYQPLAGREKGLIPLTVPKGVGKLGVAAKNHRGFGDSIASQLAAPAGLVLRQEIPFEKEPERSAFYNGHSDYIAGRISKTVSGLPPDCQLGIAQPPDIGALADHVYREIERRLKMEKARKGR